ncbi:serine/threonine-protein kinase [Streptomyces sp. H10-C2]|uniref:serine/threonine-protein kinase n=1 Tax=unclassified Streptomyces TaxID=2593676 RepID=UPI0024BAF758|nr:MULTISPECIES: serine/threonine-protein kinase [unclassified Streptomyces]MDJ0344751.1 serine/threonine-protein kinase [Streptomyces sp. PH10-H1]MDJ0371242.1 serine/threonine-protein kinase [Streptomyces sp. H10-C2]
MTVPAGYRVEGWEVTERIGEGSWGIVYAARRYGRPGSDQPADVALKFFSTAGLAPRQARLLAETAEREVAFSRAASHPHLIRVLGTTVISDSALPALDGAVVLIMERASRSLLDFMNTPDTSASTDAQGEAPVSRMPDAGALLAQICEALDYLHTAGWVHGDLKPGNVLLMADGAVRLADFGLAAQVEGTHGYAPPMGSPDYLPPERSRELLSERGVATRPSLDVWALGVTAHQVLTGGSLPFPGATSGARAAAMHEYGAGRARLRLAPELPAVWHSVISDCLTADPTARAAHTMATLLPRIRAAAAQAGPPRSRRRIRRSAVVAAAALLGAGGTAAALAWSAGSLPWASAVLAPSSDADSKDSTRPSASADPTRVRVFNIDGACKDQTERLPACSLGLARDPHKKYEARNVFMENRVWHGDALTADCVVNDGDRVADETNIGTPVWYRVQLPGVPGTHAWLPSVRTHDRPAVPVCAASALP